MNGLQIPALRSPDETEHVRADGCRLRAPDVHQETLFRRDARNRDAEVPPGTRSDSSPISHRRHDKNQRDQSSSKGGQEDGPEPSSPLRVTAPIFMRRHGSQPQHPVPPQLELWATGESASVQAVQRRPRSSEDVVADAFRKESDKADSTFKRPFEQCQGWTGMSGWHCMPRQARRERSGHCFHWVSTDM